MDTDTFISIAGYIIAAFMLGFVVGSERSQRAWYVLFDRLTSVMEKQEEDLSHIVIPEEPDEGEEWKR